MRVISTGENSRSSHYGNVQARKTHWSILAEDEATSKVSAWTSVHRIEPQGCPKNSHRPHAFGFEMHTIKIQGRVTLNAVRIRNEASCPAGSTKQHECTVNCTWQQVCGWYTSLTAFMRARDVLDNMVIQNNGNCQSTWTSVQLLFSSVVSIAKLSKTWIAPESCSNEYFLLRHSMLTYL